ncbi:hypothetical protein HDU87_003391, partial [Geranomyces variabilis]
MGDFKCVVTCPSGFVTAPSEDSCLPPKSRCSLAAPLILGESTSATLSSWHRVPDPQFGRQLGVWYRVENPALTTIKVSLEND